ncbi:MAG: thiamine pyrophosphate-binding protein [Bauldia sp.]|uniref:thiamine pyrophosphate-binding protein n=1 Tax=Bauldia sp. TaxID=2575872 RepID=UPI001D3D46AE|nr:thiamine pyrophosphate-binding protein [Bauldia sp.]MCB1495019.1 thiamine pyrophosphate-binding protein [Bauldia sp.]
MQGTDFILRSLVADDIGHLFLVPGGLVDPFMPAIGRVPELTPVVAAQEGGAAYMADGYARASGRFGACLCIGGPGVTNTVTALSAALTDESPVLLITGEVANYMEGLGLFQDASAGTYDDSLILAPVTGESYSIPDIRLLPQKMRGAVKRMLDGVRIPVHLSIPRDVQTGEVDVAPVPLAADLLDSEPLDSRAAARMWTLLRDAGAAPRVAILVGGGAISDDTSRDLIKAAERFAIPVATTEHAKGIFPEDHPLSLGVFGYAGTRHATDAILNQELDLLIVLGATLNVRDSMYWSDRMRPKLGILSVNISAVHVDCHRPNEHFVRGHGGAFARWLLAADETDARPLADGIAARRAWLEAVRQEERYYDIANTTSDQQPIHPARMLADTRKTMPRDTIAIVDSGAHRAFAVHYWDSYGPRQFITASALGPMGWGIGAGIGAKAARPDSPVVVFTGDGCMQMHGIEVQSAARFGLPVIYVVSNNQALGNVWLRMRKLGAVPMELTETVDHDWAGFARSLGAEGATVREAGELVPALEKALASNRTVVIDVKTDRAAGTPVEPYAEAKAAWSYHE